MESLIHYTWRHRLFPLAPLATTEGLPVEVIDPGMENRNDGPDFFNAKVKIGGMLWVGNVEIHTTASDWYAHGLIYILVIALGQMLSILLFYLLEYLKQLLHGLGP